MKNTTVLCGMVMGLTWGHGANAQPVNFGSKKTPSKASVRLMEKQDYADDAMARWERLKQSFVERTREKDPFGSNMNPRTTSVAKPVTGTKIEDIIHTEPIKVVPLKDALRKFVPTLISASQQVVMIGSHTMYVGDPVEIEHDGALFKLRIIRISSGEVEFINTENQEKGTIREHEFDPGQNESIDDLWDRIKEDKKRTLKIK